MNKPTDPNLVASSPHQQPPQVTPHNKPPQAGVTPSKPTTTKTTISSSDPPTKQPTLSEPSHSTLKPTSLNQTTKQTNRTRKGLQRVTEKIPAGEGGNQTTDSTGEAAESEQADNATQPLRTQGQLPKNSSHVQRAHQQLAICTREFHEGIHPRSGAADSRGVQSESSPQRLPWAEIST